MRLLLILSSLFSFVPLNYTFSDPYIVSSAVPGKCYVRFTAYHEDGTPSPWVVDWEDESFYQNSAGGSWTMTNLKTMDFELYGKNHPDHNLIYCGFAVKPDGQQGFPYHNEIGSNVDQKYIGVGRYFFHINSFDLNSCNIFGGVCGESSTGKVYRIGCNKFKIIPHDLSSPNVFLDPKSVAAFTDEMVGDTLAAPWYSWFTNLMEEIDQNPNGECLVEPSISLQVQNAANGSLNVCLNPIEEIILDLSNGGFVLSDLFSISITAILLNGSGEAIGTKVFESADPNLFNVSLAGFNFTPAQLQEVYQTQGSLQFQASLLMNNSVFKQTDIVNLDLANFPQQVSFSLSPQANVLPNTYFVDDNAQITFIPEDGSLSADHLVWNSSCSGCNFVGGNGNQSDYLSHQNYGQHTISLDYDSPNPDQCYVGTSQVIYLYNKLKLTVQNQDNSYRYKGCNDQENLDFILIQLKGNNSGYDLSSFKFIAKMVNPSGALIAMSELQPVVSAGVNLEISLSEFTFSQNQISQLLNGRGKIVIEFTGKTENGVAVNEVVEVVVDNGPVQLNFSIDRDEDSPSTYIYAEQESQEIRLIPSVSEYPSETIWSTGTEGMISGIDPAILSFNFFGTKEVTLSINQINDYTCFLPVTKAFRVQEELSLQFFPNPLGNDITLKVKSNNPVDDLEITVTSVDGKILRQFKFDQIAGEAVTDLFQGWEMSTKPTNEGLFYLRVSSEKNNYQKVHEIVKVNERY